MIKFGDRVRDKVSGFQGIATAKHEYMNGCIRFTVDSEEMKDGKPVDGQWYDEQQLEVVNEKALEVKPAQVGGPRGAPPSLKRPER